MREVRVRDLGELARRKRMEGNKQLTRCASLSAAGCGRGTMDSCYADCEGEELETKIHDADMTQAQKGWRGGTLAPLLRGVGQP